MSYKEFERRHYGKVSPENLEKAIKQELTIFSDSVVQALDGVLKELSEEALEKIATIGDYQDRTGKYRKSFRLMEIGTYRSPGHRLYNTNGQLTHLLEDGHATKGGTGRTKAYPHWKQTEEYVEKEAIERILKVLSE